MKRVMLSFCLVLSWFLLATSCSNYYFKDGRAELIQVSDTLLNDSSIVVGYVYDLGHSIDYPVQVAQIWIENTNLKTIPDAKGFYFIKAVPGIYTIKCQSDYNDHPDLVEEVKNLKINKNEKVHINFYLGSEDE